MGHAKRNKLVFTVKDKCRVCYTCVRECPVKAIKIINGQAEVLNERCIGCGNCVTVCSQNAKVFLDLKKEVNNLLSDNSNMVIALLAPSFPAEFGDVPDFRKLVGMIRELGFNKVMDVAFGADLVAKKYKKILDDGGSETYISSDCPAIVFYIEHYHPDLVKSIAPIASPAVATARLAREIYGKDVKTVFIGPCIAKKAESDEIDEGLTFKELRELFLAKNINHENVKESDFDGPASGMGAVFPLTRGLLQNMDKTDNVVEGRIIVDSGKSNFREAIRGYESGEISDCNLELLCCEGCIMGPGMSEKNKRFAKRSQISEYVKTKMENHNSAEWDENVTRFSNLNLTQSFMVQDRRCKLPELTAIQSILLEIGKKSLSDHLNCGACGYDTCYDHAVAILEGYAEKEMCLPYTIEKLHKSIKELNLSNEKLLKTRMALKHSEKLANMGQISAGIAHELNNPLGVITMYSNILLEELKESDPTRPDLQLIVDQASRCKNIVSNLLNFARKNKVKVEEVNICEFLYKSLKSVVIPDNISTCVKCDLKDTTVMFDAEQMIQAFTNLIKNAVEAMPFGGNLSFIVKEERDNVIIYLEDEGTGIPEENMDKLFTPFFTTKEFGKGTGLGLPLVYGIIKMHNGKIAVNSNDNPEKGKTGTTFIIKLPRIN